MQGVGAGTLAQYRQFSALVQALGKAARFTMPVLKSLEAKRPLPPTHQALDALVFDEWLTNKGWMMPTCAGTWTTAAATTTARARRACRPGRVSTTSPAAMVFLRRRRRAAEQDGVLTWPEGNGWLTQRLAAPLRAGGQLRTGCSVLRISEGRHGVEVDAYNHTTESVERWQAHARHRGAAGVCGGAGGAANPAFCAQTAQRLHWAPWLVANIHIDAPLLDHPGAAPAWDNVLYQDANPAAWAMWMPVTSAWTRALPSPPHGAELLPGTGRCAPGPRTAGNAALDALGPGGTWPPWAGPTPTWPGAPRAWRSRATGTPCPSPPGTLGF